MNSCKTCRHWSDERPWFNPTSKVLSICKRVKHLGWFEHEDAHKANDLDAFTIDGSDYKSELVTTQDFYCSHWEAKDDRN